MTKYEHGGNVWALARQTQRDIKNIVDLSSCVADKMPAELADIFSQLWLNSVLPEPYSPEFSNKYCEINKLLYGIDVLLTAGTTEAIFHLCQLFIGKKVAIVVPTYSDYERAAELAGMDINFIQMSPKEGFILQEPNFANAKLVFICNPNNPTGKLISRNQILRYADDMPDTLFVIDESYLPFAESGDSSSTCGMRRNIATLRSYSKVFCLPGLRLGYIVARTEIIKRLKSSMSPWSVSTMAQQAAVKLLNRPEIPIGGIDIGARHVFLTTLNGCGLMPIPSNTHFNLCSVLDRTATKFTEVAETAGVIVRNCMNVRGLMPDKYVRICMRSGWEASLRMITQQTRA